jgi:hypothetical protein
MLKGIRYAADFKEAAGSLVLVHAVQVKFGRLPEMAVNTGSVRRRYRDSIGHDAALFLSILFIVSSLPRVI